MLRPYTCRQTFISLLLIFACSAAYADDAKKPPYDPTSLYKRRTMQGFRLFINPKALEHERETGEALKLLDEKLAEIARRMPPDRLKRLRRVPFWVEWEDGFKTAMVCHISADWLRENGFNPEKAVGVEIVNVEKFSKWTREDQPMMVLHELAHAYHYSVLKLGNPEVRAAYEHAVKSGIYDSVDYIHGGKKRAYALTNDQEYFAELTEAYFGQNDYYPFTWEDLKKHDPEGYALMEKVWGQPRRDNKAGVMGLRIAD